MKLEQQVTSLELSKRLKNLGVKQESLFYWREDYHTEGHRNEEGEMIYTGIFGNKYSCSYHPKPRYSTADLKWNQADLNRIDQTEFSAFTVAELGEMLPARLLGKIDEDVEMIAEPEDSDEWERLVNVQKYSTAWLGTSVVSEKGGNDGWECNYASDGIQYMEFEADTEADARAKMLIYLLENKFIPNPTDNI